jgi:hypothetical protein
MRVFFYVLLLVVCLVLASFAWDYLAAGRLYFCSDSVVDFIPPFVHPHTDDHYIAPVWVVWSLWLAFVILALAGPAIAIGAASRILEGRRDEIHPN